ncbi:MAG: hypothetical protein PHX54_13400 [Lentimicrobiaceae bacterium]|nr:hypothetical protein [Lentimicrobiaceae bacterium]
MRLGACISGFILFTQVAMAQQKLVFDGQLSGYGNYSPDARLEVTLGGRYIPELNYHLPLSSGNAFDVEASVNVFGSIAFNPFYQSKSDGDIQPYRIWARYTGKQYELRLGLQKIDFGSAVILRPLQWFNQIDPRDPLKLTRGVYAALGRYYFLNNANIWVWMLYGNTEARGYDVVETRHDTPEFGGRLQYPVPKGELALSYHHRTADASAIFGESNFNKIPEDRFSLDGKWDVTVGLWFEAVHIHKTQNMGMLTNQSMLNLGMDYTFGVGNGLNVTVEHLLITGDNKAFGFENTANVTAGMISYPLGLFSRLSTVVYYSWATDDFAFFLNYERQFRKTTAYLMLYYNPDTSALLRENELVNMFPGPGVRLMWVFNH